MKKNCLFAAAFCLLLLLFSGCGQSAPNAVAYYCKGDTSFSQQMALDFADVFSQQQIPFLQNAEEGGYSKLLSEKPGVLIACAQDETEATAILRAAEKKKIPVIFYGSRPDEEEMSQYSACWYVGFDPALAGETVGTLLANAYQGGQSIDINNNLLLEFAALEDGSADAQAFVEGAVQAIEDTGFFTTNLGQFLPADFTATWGELAPQAEAILCGTEGSALSLFDFFTQNPLAEGQSLPVVLCAGSDPTLLAAAAEGKITGMAFYDPRTLSQAVAVLAANAAQKKNVTEASSYRLLADRTLYLPVTAVTPETASEALAAYTQPAY